MKIYKDEKYPLYKSGQSYLILLDAVQTVGHLTVKEFPRGFT